jgi:glycerol-3-phosphate dehydrogenase (NAD(P)+)
MEAAVLGAGAFGVALTKILEARGHRVDLWVRSPEAAARIAETRESTYLPGVQFGPSITPTSDLARAVAGKPLIVSVTPSHVARHVLSEAAPHIDKEAVIANASKGIEEGTLQTIDQIYAQVLPAPIAERASFLSGPTFAKELARGLPAAIVVASHRADSALLVQRELANDRFRVYTTDDVTGVEVGGALKNICAIGAGIADGLGYGHNTRAALITRGLSEIARLGVRLGANPLTFAGLAGMGDLVLTCTGDLSRNRQVGLELGKGRTIEDILAGMSSVAEGVKTTRAAHDLGKKVGVELPITDAIYSILYEGKAPREAVAELLKREPRAERD